MNRNLHHCDYFESFIDNFWSDYTDRSLTDLGFEISPNEVLDAIKSLKGRLI